jgi:hypothetical protein
LEGEGLEGESALGGPASVDGGFSDASTLRNLLDGEINEATLFEEVPRGVENREL